MSKSNLGRLAPSLRWELLDTGDVGRVNWLGEVAGLTADDLVGDGQEIGEARGKREHATALLNEMLADAEPPHFVVIKEANGVAFDFGISPPNHAASSQRPWPDDEKPRFWTRLQRLLPWFSIVEARQDDLRTDLGWHLAPRTILTRPVPA